MINGVLQTSYSVMRRYEFEHKSEELWREIKFVLDNFAQPLTNLLVVSSFRFYVNLEVEELECVMYIKFIVL